MAIRFTRLEPQALALILEFQGRPDEPEDV